MKKKLLLALMMSVLLVGCGNTDTTDSADGTEVNETQKQEEHLHAYTESITTEVTCEADGVKTFICECGDSYTEAIPATGHVYENYTSNEDATYLADGTETGTCICGMTDTRTVEGSKLEYTIDEQSVTMYAIQSVNVRDLPSSDGNKLGRLSEGQEVTVTGQCQETNWYRIEFNGGVGYVSNKYLSDTKPSSEPQATGGQTNSGYPYADRYNMYTDRVPASQEEINQYTYTEMNAILYPTNRIVFWRLPVSSDDFAFFCDQNNYMGWAMKFVPVQVTGVCNETGAYRVVMDGITVFIPKNEGSFGEPQFVSSIPAVTKADPGYETGTPEWHAYWDGTRVDNYYMSTGMDLWITIKDENGVLYYSGSYPNAYIIGSYADVTVGGVTKKGEY